MLKDFKKLYLKYKSKYINLKNQLGGIDPTPYNSIDFDDNLYTIMANLLADIIIFTICKNTGFGFSTEQKAQLEIYINNGFFNELISIKDSFRNTIKNILINIIDNNMIIKNLYRNSDDKHKSTYMKILEFQTPEIDGFDNNIHITLVKSIKKTNINYHLSYSYKKHSVSPFISTHYNTEEEVFNGLVQLYNMIQQQELNDKSRKYYLKCFIVLSVFCINFSKTNDSRNTFNNLLIDASTKQYISDFIDNLLIWIDQFINIILVSNSKDILKPSVPYDNINIFLENFENITNRNKEEKIAKERLALEKIKKEQELKEKIALEKIRKEQELKEKQDKENIAVQLTKEEKMKEDLKLRYDFANKLDDFIKKYKEYLLETAKDIINKEDIITIFTKYIDNYIKYKDSHKEFVKNLKLTKIQKTLLEVNIPKIIKKDYIIKIT